MELPVFVSLLCLTFILFFNLSLGDDHLESVDFDNIPLLGDTSAIEISLFNYSIYNPKGESIEQFATITPSSEIEIIVNNIPSNVHFILVQTHSYQHNLTLSYYQVPNIQTSVNGTNIGLIKSSQTTFSSHLSTVSFYLTNYSPTNNVTFLVSVQGYGETAPVPGGCNMEFHIEIAPYLETRYNKDIIQVDFALASISETMLDSMSVSSEATCELKPSPINHDVYHVYLPEQDYSIQSYFLYIRRMMTVGRISNYGTLVKEPVSNMVTRRNFAAYPGLGRVVVVVAHTPTDSSVYVPYLTYAFNNEKMSSYNPVSTTLARVACAVILFLGLFACFCGHWYFKTHLFLLGLLSGGLITYIIFYHFYTFDNEADMLSASIAGGSVFGALWLSLWCCYSVPVLTILLSTTTLGYLFASIVFYMLTDVFEFLENDVNYGATFGSLTLLAPILLLSLAEVANVVSCAILGAYAAVMPIDQYVGSNLRYIVVNSVRRATVGRFNTAVIDPPFQVRDIVLVGLWVVLSIIGIRLQLWIIKNKAPFPSSPNFIPKLCHLCKRSSSTISTPNNNERSPLLDNRYWCDHTNPTTAWNYPVSQQYSKYPYYPYRENYGSV